MTTVPPRRRPHRVHANGFTLIELVVVVGIIIALLSLVLAVSTLLIQQNEARQMQSAFANLETAVLEYEQAVGRPITFQDRPDPAGAYDVSNNPNLGVTGLESPYMESATQGVVCPSCTSGSDYRGWSRFIVQLMSLLARTQSAEDIVARLDSSLFIPVRLSNGQPLPNNASLSTLVDPWGTPVAVVFPGRQWREGIDPEDKRDADGTIRTYFENKAGICRNGKVLFVSAGPDGDLGCLTCSGSGGARYEASLDNIYSYEPGTP